MSDQAITELCNILRRGFGILTDDSMVFQEKRLDRFVTNTDDCGTCLHVTNSANTDGSCWADSLTTAFMYPAEFRAWFAHFSEKLGQKGKEYKHLNNVITELLRFHDERNYRPLLCPSTSPARLFFNELMVSADFPKNFQKNGRHIMPVAAFHIAAALHYIGQEVDMVPFSFTSELQKLSGAICVLSNSRKNPLQSGGYELVSIVIEIDGHHSMCFVRCNENNNQWIMNRALGEQSPADRGRSTHRSAISFALNSINPFEDLKGAVVFAYKDSQGVLHEVNSCIQTRNVFSCYVWANKSTLHPPRVPFPDFRNALEQIHLSPDVVEKLIDMTPLDILSKKDQFHKIVHQPIPQIRVKELAQAYKDVFPFRKALNMYLKNEKRSYVSEKIVSLLTLSPAFIVQIGSKNLKQNFGLNKEDAKYIAEMARRYN